MVVNADDNLIQLATRIPARLHRAIRLHCVGDGTTVMEFVTAGLEDRLKKIRGRSGRAGNRQKRSRRTR